MWSSLCKNWAKTNGQCRERRAPKFGVDGTGWWGRLAEPERIGGSRQPAKPQQQAGDGKRESQRKQGFAKVVEKRELQRVIMAAAAKVAKRVPLIKFPNRRAGETQGAGIAIASWSSLNCIWE